MKFKIKDLLKAHINASHLFLNCVTDEVAKKITSQEKYDINTTEVDMKLYIEDTEVDLTKFIDCLMNSYDEQIKIKAEELLKEKLSKKVDEIACTLDNLHVKLTNLEDNISWDENLLK